MLIEANKLIYNNTIKYLQVEQVANESTKFIKCVCHSSYQWYSL